MTYTRGMKTILAYSLLTISCVAADPHDLKSFVYWEKIVIKTNYGYEERWNKREMKMLCGYSRPVKARAQQGGVK